MAGKTIDDAVLEAAFIKAGFDAPPKEWVRTDCRGKEYGYYRAFATGNSEIAVQKRDAAGDLIYTMYFDSPTDFCLWSAAN